MFDGTIHAKTLTRQLRKSDFESKPYKITLASKDEVVDAAIRLARSGSQRLTLRTSSVKGKRAYRLISLEEELLIRHASENVRRVTGVKQADRNSIIKSMKALLKEGLDYNVIRLDIKSFYETIMIDPILINLKRDHAFSRQSIAVLENFFAALQRQNVPGLPRGIGLSATLAEYAMRRFDAVMSDAKGVRYYNRFVDDIIIITAPDVNTRDFYRIAKKHLPAGLNLNYAKCQSYNFKKPARISSDRSIENSIPFLGYEFHVSTIFKSETNDAERDVRIDIAPKKVDRMKKRIAISFLKYLNDKNYNKLSARMKILTANHYVIDRLGRKKFSGIKFDYPMIDIERSSAISDLDDYRRHLIIGLSKRFGSTITMSFRQRDALLGLSFAASFKRTRFFSMSEKDIKNLSACWSHA